MPIEIIGLIYHQITSPAAASVPATDFDLDAIHALSRAHEGSGFDRVLISQSATMPDPLMIASYVASRTSKLKFMVAHRPGFMAPTMAARIFATLDQLSGGRASIHVISGAQDAEMLRDGDALTKEQRYRRSREYALIMRALWAATAPIDHQGEFYRFEQAFCDVKPLRPEGLMVSWAGASPLAFETAGECADVYAMVGDAPEAAQEFVDTVRRSATRHGRRMAFAITLCVILGTTEEQAWINAREVLARIEARLAAQRDSAPVAPHASVAFQRLLDRSKQTDIVGKNLWLAINRVTGVAGNNTTIVGTPEQVVETLMIYHDIGFTSFLLRGFDPLVDAETFGEELIPRFRAAVAKRDAAAANRANIAMSTSVQTR